MRPPPACGCVFPYKGSGEGRRPPRSGGGGGDAARKGWVAEEGASGVRRSKIWVERESLRAGSADLGKHG
jgi:hypothetical protein